MQQPKPIPDAPQSMAVTQTSVQVKAAKGTAYTAIASLITLLIGFFRSVLLARLLAPEDYGVVTFALFFVSFFGSLTPFSLRQAFIHSDSEDEERIAGTLLTVDLGLAVLRWLIIFLISPWLTSIYPQYPQLSRVLQILFAAYIFGAATGAPLAILERRMAYRRIAFLSVIVSTCITVATVWMALNHWGVWALVAEAVLTRLIMFIGLFLIRPPWKARLHWDKSFLQRFSKFSLTVSITSVLGFLIDQFDDFWVGAALGKTPLGYYAKAYEYARYPRRVLSDPVISVTFPAFARLKDNTYELSQVFVRGLGILIRVSFWIAITMFLTAPEMIELFIGAKWLPMMNTFRWMLLYTLLDPLVAIIGMLFTALGKPQVATQVRLMQMAVFIPGVIFLGTHFGIEGVAIAADIMVLLGAVFLLSKAHQVVDFSFLRLFGFPIIGLLCVSLVTYYVDTWWFVNTLMPVRFIGKCGVIFVVYFSILAVFEYKMYMKYGASLYALIQHRYADFRTKGAV